MSRELGRDRAADTTTRAGDEPLPAGELLAREVRCAVCGRVEPARQPSAGSRGAQLLPQFEALPVSWTLLLADPPLPLCSTACSQRLATPERAQPPL